KDTYLTNIGLAFWLCVDNGAFFLMAVPGEKKESSDVPAAGSFLANKEAPAGLQINQLKAYTDQARNDQYDIIKKSQTTSFVFDAAALAALAGIDQSVVTEITIHLIFIKDEKSQLDCLTLALKIDETKAYAGVPCPPVCYYG
ncbi:MAG: hypothetical protein IT269_03150, partial [Saprospiraceae bacterium]|nr:hypothetical protein [Saprospiraceae bacterium]